MKRCPRLECGGVGRGRGRDGAGHSGDRSAGGAPLPFKVVIPARHASARLPGKPLLEIAGKPLIRHVYERAQATAAAEILIATDDARIAAACQAFGAEVVMTRADHHTGSDRLGEVIAARGWDDETLVVNLQGDEPCMPPALVDQVAAGLAGHGRSVWRPWPTPFRTPRPSSIPMWSRWSSTPRATPCISPAPPSPGIGTNSRGGRQPLPPGVRFLRHIGLYAYRAAFLPRFVAWPPSPLEVLPSPSEQLRVLWHGEGIHVGLAHRGAGPRGGYRLADVQRLLEFLGRGQAAGGGSSDPGGDWQP